MMNTITTELWDSQYERSVQIRNQKVIEIAPAAPEWAREPVAGDPRAIEQRNARPGGRGQGHHQVPHAQAGQAAGVAAAVVVRTGGAQVPVAEVMTRDVVSVPEDMGIDTLRTLLLDQMQRALRHAQRLEQQRVPLVRERVRAFFGLEPYTALDPDTVVALGAAVQGSILAGAHRGSLLLDVKILILTLFRGFGQKHAY